MHHDVPTRRQDLQPPPLGNQVQVSFTSLLASVPYIKNGKLRALGVTSS